ncbi:spore germination protein YaaH [Neolewinella xylanilytica]|uniref:Spore germination protein YaaH n=1 Tax=Neolewinella xylanilytica TaxID=1514080 RepID=A0A2S6I989_9BACT|nr:glycosyl hydrolase family 18 protein [Neolewinella xylanilytica]PPK88061.1 spore germination protein YaaH [Neolewinella xylanilytica]
MRFTRLLLTLFLIASLASVTGQEEPSRIDRFLQLFVQSSADSSTGTFNTDRPDLQPAERYGYVYNLVHREQHARYRRLSDSMLLTPDQLRYADYRPVAYAAGDTVVLAKDIRVFGWHPHWMATAYQQYRYELLSHVGLFAYDIDVEENGALYTNPDVVRGWEADDFDLVDRAHARGTRVQLTLTSFGTRNNRIFLADLDLQDRLIGDIVGRVMAMGADGINVDFELIPEGFEDHFTAFIVALSERLRTANAAAELSVVLPKMNRNRSQRPIFRLDDLQPHVDFFILTAYDFVTGRDLPGPIAPLYAPRAQRTGYGSIEEVVYAYLDEGVDRKKLVVGLPYYGGKWTRAKAADGSDTTYFDHVTYGSVRARLRGLDNTAYDPTRWSVKLDRSSVGGGPEGTDPLLETIWCDDSLTLNVKYDWVLEEGLGGVGIWALGYDQPGTELWSLLQRKFAPASDTLVYVSPNRTWLAAGTGVYAYRHPILITLLFVFLILVAGFVAALFDWRVRDTFFRNATLRRLYIGAALILLPALLMLGVYLLDYQPSTEHPGFWLALIVSAVLGALLARGISNVFWQHRAELP